MMANPRGKNFGTPMTLANMRANGVRGVIAKCEACGHAADVNVDALAETIVAPEVGRPCAVADAAESRSMSGEHGTLATRRGGEASPWLAPLDHAPGQGQRTGREGAGGLPRAIIVSRQPQKHVAMTGDGWRTNSRTRSSSSSSTIRSIGDRSWCASPGRAIRAIAG
jgi:hypothetical protein